MENENGVVTPNETVPEKKGFSITSMILGIVGLFVFSIPCGVLAIVFGAIGRKKGGKGFATAGLILGIIATAYGVINFIIGMASLVSIFTLL